MHNAHAPKMQGRETTNRPDPELACLLSQLASRFRRAGIAAGEPSAQLVSLAASLSPDGDHLAPRVRVLDAALSLMCFNPSEVFTSRIKLLVHTIISVLHSLSSCHVLHCGGGKELLIAGNSISSRDCSDIMWVCTKILEISGDHIDSHNLLYAILKVAISSCCNPPLFPLTYDDEAEEGSYDMRFEVTKLIRYLPKELRFSDNAISLRVLLWYLDPSNLKHDVSEMLQEAVQRPFLSLKKEMYDRTTWHTILICFVTCPLIFMETRTLLHSWLLMTGLAPVLKLQIGIVSSALDFLSRPMKWGISMESGLKYPFSQAYFPSKHHDLLAILTGPLSCRKFLDLVSHINAFVAPSVKLSNPSYPSHTGSEVEASVEMIGDDSAWALIMNFPSWFHFSTALVFHGDGSESAFSRVISNETVSEAIDEVELTQAAALFIAWILCPINGSECSLLADHIFQTSRSLVNKYRSRYKSEHDPFSVMNSRDTIHHSKSLRGPRVDRESVHMATEYDYLTLYTCLKEFDSYGTKFHSRSTVSRVLAKGKPEQVASVPFNLLYLKIPVGILLACPSFSDEKGYDMLLNYAANGEVLLPKEVDRKTKASLELEGFSLCYGRDAEKWALNGACLVFDLMDIFEDISLIFDCNDTRLSFICELKRKSCRYLLSCVNELFAAHKDAVGVDREKMGDLHRRLVQLRQTDQDIFGECDAFEELIEEFNKKFHVA